MKSKKTAYPTPSEGVDFSKEKDVVVPNQAMSLKEILERFTRNQALPIGQPVEFGDDNIDNPLNVDLEKVAHMDLVDKDEFRKQLQDVVDRDAANKKAKADKKAKSEAEAKKLAEEKRIEEEVMKRTKEGSPKSA